MGANGTSRFENQLRGTCQDNNQLNTAFSLQPVRVTNRCNAHDLLAAFGVRRRLSHPASTRTPMLHAGCKADVGPQSRPARHCQHSHVRHQAQRTNYIDPSPLSPKFKLVVIFTSNSTSEFLSTLYCRPPVLHSKMPISRNPQQQRERADVNNNDTSSSPTIPTTSLAG